MPSESKQESIDLNEPRPVVDLPLDDETEMDAPLEEETEETHDIENPETTHEETTLPSDVPFVLLKANNYHGKNKLYGESDEVMKEILQPSTKVQYQIVQKDNQTKMRLRITGLNRTLLPSHTFRLFVTRVTLDELSQIRKGETFTTTDLYQMTKDREHMRYTIPGEKGINLTHLVRGEGKADEKIVSVDAPRELRPGAPKTIWVPCLIFRLKKKKK